MYSSHKVCVLDLVQLEDNLEVIFQYIQYTNFNYGKKDNDEFLDATASLDYGTSVSK